MHDNNGNVIVHNYVKDKFFERMHSIQRDYTLYGISNIVVY